MTTIFTQRRQGGFSLAIALLIVGSMAGVLTAIITSQRGETQNAEARIAGWQAVEIARAARIHVRNLIATATPPPTQSNRQAIATAFAIPAQISLNTLINNNLLPANFARGEDIDMDGIDDIYFNVLGQEIRVILANYPLGGDPANDTTVPTAYVYFVSPATTAADDEIRRRRAKLAQDVIQGVRASDASISAPLFEITNTSDTNLSGTCSTSNPLNTDGDAVVIWDSGCLDTNEFNALTGMTNFEPGSFILPAWRTVNFDARALMRFPQPELTDLQTMQTDLSMASMQDCTIDTNGDGIPDHAIMIPGDIDVDGDGNADDVATPVCSAINDDLTTSQDNRRAILGVNNLQSVNLIINPQTDPSLEMNTYLGPADSGQDLNIGGNLQITGDVKVFDGITTINQDLEVDRNIILSGSDNPSATVGSLETGSLNSNNVTTVNAASVPANIFVSDAINNIGTLTAGEDLIASNADSNSASPNIVVTNEANFIQPTIPLRVQGTLTVEGTSPVSNSWSAVTALMEVGTNANNITNLNIGNSADIDNANIRMTEVTNVTGNAECIGDCPLREERTICLSQTITTYEDCMNSYRLP